MPTEITNFCYLAQLCIFLWEVCSGKSENGWMKTLIYKLINLISLNWVKCLWKNRSYEVLYCKKRYIFANSLCGLIWYILCIQEIVCERVTAYEKKNCTYASNICSWNFNFLIRSRNSFTNILTQYKFKQTYSFNFHSKEINQRIVE